MGKNDYFMSTRIRDNLCHAEQVQMYWKAKGYDVAVSVVTEGPNAGEIVSDTLNGMPRKITGTDAGKLLDGDEAKIREIENMFLETYGVKLTEIAMRAHKNDRPEIGMARSAIWHALSRDLGMSAQDIGKRYGRGRRLVMRTIREAEGKK